MAESTLSGLGIAYASWRKRKRYARESVPKALWEQTLRAAEIHGVVAVSRVTKIQRSRIGERVGKGKRQASVPSFSRVLIEAPTVPDNPIAEVETGSGLKLRIFVQSAEMFQFLSSLCSTGGAQ